MTPSRRPNFIFILADDLGYADLGCTGAMDERNRPANISPNLDRLAQRGVRFTRGYSNSAVCSPTRFALITGRWQYRLRGGAEEPLPTVMRDDKVLGLPPEHPTFPSLLGAAGYDTALIGKWHLGPPPLFGPTKSGYDYFFGFHAGGSDYFAHCDPRGRPDLWENDQPIEREGYLTDLLSRRACDYIDAADDARPFCLSLHYSAPHWPWLTREDADESRRIAGIGKHLDGGSIRTYQRMIHHMDEGIGWIVAALEKKGVLDDTFIVFTSDNGGERFSNNWPFVGQKMDLLEGGIRVPVLASWPNGLPRGELSDLPHMTMDWTATFLDAAGVGAAPGYPLDGVSLLPALRGHAPAVQRDLCWRMKHRDQRALIRGNWKFLQVEGIPYLFDLSRDERERANLRDREPGKLAELMEAWRAWDASLPPIPEDAQAHLVFDKRQLPQATF
ncbi:twin-arginine translocation pathway signal protein [Bordetella genomosp. 9]|uniref:Twin-arginine translocation pathway signal protein n=1 Tax=Bordetella genomosp. 9 TaxID=1416803 RepID=A0A261R329_9BORD|nr:sulfatase-like hydrolase/transferase [Bordetella genomosp. 9]OZI18733.1 twin-arginine translocation pathway signal protein [Bordetella genomosp. 9]